MDEFDLDRLTGHDFESLCQDLFQEILGVDLEIFPAGPDGGIDLRHVEFNGATTVIQCKRWTEPAGAKLVRHFRDTEAQKVRAAEPTRYILATTVDLNAVAKRSLIEILTPYVRSPGDLYGRQQIVAALRQRRHIVDRHLRLWLSSSSALLRALNRDVGQRSRSLAREIDDALKIYVPGSDFEKARQICDSQHAVIITGAPGVGKSMLAKVVAADLVRQGYQLIDASESLREIDKVREDGARQVFVLDDFLGEISLDADRADAASRALLRLLHEVAEDDTKRLVLTTRDYVLEAARERKETLHHAPLDPLRLTIEVGRFSRRVKAAMLYNHVFHSTLPTAVRQQFAHPSVYEPVIDHRNFHPRILDHVLRSAAAGQDDRGDIVTRLLRALANPSRVWSHLFEEILDAEEIAVPIVLSVLPGRVPTLVLYDRWLSYLGANAADPETMRTFRRVLRRQIGTVLRSDSELSRRPVRVSLRDPSVLDYLKAHLRRQPELAVRLLATAVSFEEILRTWSMAGVQVEQTRPDVIGAFLDALEQLVDASRPQWRPSSDPGPGRLVLRLLDVDVRSDRLATLAAVVLDDVREWAARTPAAELVAIVTKIRACSAATVRQRLGLVVIQTERELRREAADWDNRTEIMQLIEDLDDLAPRDLANELADAYDDVAINVIEDWDGAEEAAPDVNDEVDESALREAVEWLEERGRQSEPGFDEASRYLHEFDRVYTVTRGAAAVRDRSEYEKRTSEISDIFSTLGVLHEDRLD